MSVAEAIGLMLSFGMFLISLLNFIRKSSTKKHNKKDRR